MMYFDATTSAIVGMYVDPVAPEIKVQPAGRDDPAETCDVQSYHWYVYVGAGTAVQSPFTAVSVDPANGVPVIDGADPVIDAITAAIDDVAEYAVSAPAEFVAVSATNKFAAVTSAVTTLYVCDVAPEIAAQFAFREESTVVTCASPEDVVQRYHWYEIDGVG